MSDIQKKIEFNESWWNAVQEGEPIAQDEIEEVREMIGHLKHAQSIISQQEEEITKLNEKIEDGLFQFQMLQIKNVKMAAEIERLKREYEELEEQADRWREESGN